MTSEDYKKLTKHDEFVFPNISLPILLLPKNFWNRNFPKHNVIRLRHNIKREIKLFILTH